MSQRRLKVVIEGCGLGGLIAANLLARSGAEVVACERLSGNGRVISISLENVVLAGKVLGVPPSRIFAGHLLKGRSVCWSSEAVVVDDPSLVIDTRAVSAALMRLLAEQQTVTFRDGCMGEADWRVIAVGRPGVRAGNRVGQLCRVRFREDQPLLADLKASAKGWSFALPTDRRAGVLLQVAPENQYLPSAGTLYADLVEQGFAVAEAQIIDGPLPLAPALADDLCCGHCARVGDAAAAFDPLCGDGFGRAVRAAILLHAMVVAIDSGEPHAPCASHYRERLRSTFRSHLKSCIEHYSTSRSAGIWHTEIASMQHILDGMGTDDRVSGSYRLEGLQLIRA